MSADWNTVAALALAVGAASFTLAKTKATEPLRQRLGDRVQRRRHPQSESVFVLKDRWYWAYALASCPYCLGHWLSAVAVLIYRPRLTSGWPVADLGVSWLAVTALAAGVAGLIDRAIHPK